MCTNYIYVYRLKWYFFFKHSLFPCTTYESKIIKITDEAFPRRFQRYIHVKLPSHDNLALLMEKKMAGYHHTVTRPEFKYLAKKLIGFGPTDVHKMLDLALTQKMTNLYEKKYFKWIALENGPHLCPTSEKNFQKVAVSRNTLMTSPCAFQPVTVKDLLKIIEGAKPSVKESTTQRYAEFEKSRGTLG